MAAKLISGKEIAKTVYEHLKSRIKIIKKICGKTPGLAVILVGNNPASQVYVRMKTKMCEKLGILSEHIELAGSASHQEVIDNVKKLNNNNDIDGILVQLPLPSQCGENIILNTISPDKDVDGFHPENMGNLLIGKPKFIPCTPLGIWVMLKQSGYSPEGKHVVIVGRSNIVGKPMFSILCQKTKYANATVTLCHSRTKNLPEITKTADILIAAIGRPHFITKEMVKPGTVVVDVGINRVDDSSSPRGYKLVGDVDFDEVSKAAEAITPVPGGVGPMTIAMLMNNTILSCETKHGITAPSILD
ncbi:bifunctional methylenetetrahydrofolate dehydrogenase/methenyltetrahydrofolate cyclohydrolase FolD [bacterium]|nr:bifunctional methylenetetrahydrofolate dehydrogenase/methenyltetrahydrofolate cyclohydrolase FolD [bacterium]